MKKSIFLALFTICVLNIFAQSKYAQINVFHIASPGGWDYITINPASNKLYMSHGTQVNILDKITGDSLGVISNTIGVHGIAFINETKKGFIR